MSSIARFRTSSHCLFIELGRHYRPPIPVNLRTCKYCTLGNVDNELHMLLRCTFHSNERNIFLNELGLLSKFNIPLRNYCDEDLFRFILQQSDSSTINYLGKFLSNGFINRLKRRDAVIMISYLVIAICIVLQRIFISHTDSGGY